MEYPMMKTQYDQSLINKAVTALKAGTPVGDVVKQLGEEYDAVPGISTIYMWARKHGGTKPASRASRPLSNVDRLIAQYDATQSESDVRAENKQLRDLVVNLLLRNQ
jgi:hypothetical protein